MKIIFRKCFYICIFLPFLIQNAYLDLNILKTPLLYKSPYLINDELNKSISSFLETFTNFTINDSDVKHCLSNITSTDLGFIYIYSGKGIAEPGLESECTLLTNFKYFFLTYLYNLPYEKDYEIYNFIGQKSFYTGFCIPQYCEGFLTKLLNSTNNSIFLSYLKKEWYLEKIKFDHKTEENHDIVLLIIILIIFFLIIQIIFSFLYNCIYMTGQNENNIIKEDDYMNENNEIKVFDDKRIPLIENENTTSCWYLLLSNCNIINFFMILLKKKNEIYDETNLEFIAFLRVLIIMGITFIQNTFILTEIPAKDFFEKEFYESFFFFIIKISTFSLECYISIEGFLMIFKLFSYIKKNVYEHNKNNVNYSIFLSFIYHSFYKIFSSIILFLIFDYIYGDNLIYFFSTGSLHIHYKNHIYNEAIYKKVTKLIFPSTLLSPYISDLENSFYSYYTYIILYLNEFYIFLFSLLLIYTSFKLKNKVFDIIIFILIILNILLTYLVQFQEYKDNNIEYYDFHKIINPMYSIKYPHLMLNNYFMGIFAGIICFSLKDFLSNKSIFQSDNKYIPFIFLFDRFRIFFGLISDKIKIILIIVFSVILILISSSFYFLQQNGDLLLKFNFIEKIIYYYDKSLILIFFNLIIIFVYSLDYNMSKGNNFFNFFIFFSRMDFSFIITAGKFIYSLYCLYNFQLKLSYPNLIIVSFGLFMNLLFVNIILTLTIVLPIKLIFKKIIA